ncbi:DBF4-type zinc finger-containing protein 2 [Aulostomus maculatus]
MEASDWPESLLITDEQSKAEAACRMWAESEPGPSRCQPSRQGYCGYCRVLYHNLDQHLSSLRHLDSVQASSRGSSNISSSSSSRTKLTLLERFLQDVLQHHPHHYNDPRPTHADLPSVSAPLLPRGALDELCFSDDESQSLGTRKHLPCPDDVSCQLANQEEDLGTCSQSGKEVSEEAPPPHPQAPPSIHRKAHRKTNRRKSSKSLSPVPPPSADPVSGPGPGPEHCPSSGLRPQTMLDLKPWLSWQRQRWEEHKQEAFSSDDSDPLDQTIEEVIQVCCYGIGSARCQEEETGSFHFSLPISLETASENWDSTVQASRTPVQVSQVERQDLSHLMDVQVDLKDQLYSYQLDSALNNQQEAGGGARRDQGFWTLPIEEVLPAPEHIPESFRGKTWAQIEQEDEEKVNKLVRQFRRGRFVCYFDSESLARYGRRSREDHGETQRAELEPSVVHLMEHDEHSAYKKKRGRSFRVASRCQVVKVSHGTQTPRVVVPTVRQPASEDPPTIVPPATQEAASRTPEALSWRRFPPSYSNIITPLQSRTSLVYLLCSPTSPAPTLTPVAGSTPKRCRRKKRPLELEGLKVKYKRFPVRFYDLTSNRILKNPPKALLWSKGSAPSSAPPLSCVRQLFRSLSPDLNTERPPTDICSGSSRVKGQRLSDNTSTFSSHFLLSTLSREPAVTDKQDSTRRRGRASVALPPVPNTRSGRGVGKERTRLLPKRRANRSQATPLSTRRSGVRQTGSSPLVPKQPHPRRGRTRRGRGCDKARR